MGCVTLEGYSEALSEAFIVPAHKINIAFVLKTNFSFVVIINSQISSKGVGTVRAYDVKNARKRAYRRPLAT